jgi:hypothetical protein
MRPGMPDVAIASASASASAIASLLLEKFPGTNKTNRVEGQSDGCRQKQYVGPEVVAVQPKCQLVACRWRRD